MSETSFLFSLPSFEHRELSGVETGKARKLKTKMKQDRIKAMRQETADQFLDRLPVDGEQIHILSNGKFDYWGLITRGMELTRGQIESLFVSTWTMNLPNAPPCVPVDLGGVFLWLRCAIRARACANYIPFLQTTRLLFI